MDSIVIMEKREQQMWTINRKLKAAEAALARKRALPTVTETFVVVPEDDDGANSESNEVEGGRYLQRTTDFEARCKAAGAIAKEAVADLEGRGNMDVLKTRDLDLVEEGGQSDGLRSLCKGFRKRKLGHMLPALQKKLLVKTFCWRRAHFWLK